MEFAQAVRDDPDTDKLRLRADALEKRADSLEGWARTSAERTSFLETVASEIDGFRMARARQIAGQQRLAEKFAVSVSALVERVEALSDTLSTLQRRVDALEAREESRSVSLAEQITSLQTRQETVLGAVSAQSREILRIEQQMDAVTAAGGTGPGGTLRDGQAHLLDPLYVAFEDKARGSREEIKQRQSVYLPLVHEVGAGTTDRPVLDLGAGRGEWLELLRDHRLVARGVDLNEAMVGVCTSMGLDCIEGNALATLNALPRASVGLITGFHIIEHLPYEIFVGVLDAALHVLAPGGALLFETPDPQNVIVGSHTFYMDPTHRNPMPSLMVRIMAEARGFGRVEIRRMNPSPSRFSGQDGELIGQLNDLFFGPQDYAMIAYKS